MSELEHHEHKSDLCDGENGEEDDKEVKNREDGGDDRDGEVRRKGVFKISRDFKSAINRPFRKWKKEERCDGEIIKLPSARRRERRIQYGGRSGGGVGGFYVCFLRPRTEESSETLTSDPNSETFSFGMLRTLIEKNDFHCKECNPHI